MPNRRLEPRSIVDLQYHKTKPSPKGEGEFLFTRKEIDLYMVEKTGYKLSTVMLWHFQPLKRDFFPKPPTTKARVDTFLRIFCTSHRHPPLSLPRYKDEIYRLRAEGKTYEQISAILGCSTWTIWVWLVKKRRTNDSKATTKS